MEKEKPLKDCKDLPCPEIDDYKPSTPGVLLSHEIKYYAEKYQMISPFAPDLLKPAGYRLRLGEEYAIGGELKKLYQEPGKDELVIPPFEVAIISTMETINLPRFIIARWNLRVSLVYEGLLWTGALQVDPGWCGPLHCPIYNLSNESVVLKLGEPIVLMDFVKTTPFEKNSSKEYVRPPAKSTLRDYPYRLKSALFTQAGQKIETIENKVNRVESFIAILFTSIAILFTSLAVLVTSLKTSADMSSPPSWFIFWVVINLILSSSSLALSLFFRGKPRIESRWLKLTVVVLSIVIFIGGAFIIQYKYSKEEIRTQVEKSLKNEIQSYLNAQKESENKAIKKQEKAEPKQTAQPTDASKNK